jgi:hypothetical protein
VKPLSADGSVGSPHARVGHRQAPIKKNPEHSVLGVFCWEKEKTANKKAACAAQVKKKIEEKSKD